MVFIEYVLIFLAAATPWLEIALVIPLGIIRGHSPILVMLVGFLGNMVTIVLLIALFEKVRAYFAKKAKTEKKKNKRQERAKKIWNRYGLPGLALLGPILIGTHIAAFIGMSLGAQKSWTLLWLTISIGIWSLVFGIATMLGFDFFVQESVN
ncbi:small multi-drug export protein [Jeotgalibacillus proteolyticus]|uniref:DNA-binding protein n=1 Tax=Jeotgalibacillus proteolyticus TaxID=2082395 RepID=A0A2S5GFA6_9BACL|nr:small multi-drug export protein [Jeotgalibacillus proteolyticus]PPA71595.1 DNA-binding protein [Jeotgalibacillus proteolyticus]